MATIEKVIFNNYKHKEVNISYLIGTGEKNEKNDVLLVQALFKLIAWSDSFSKQTIGLGKNDLPEITGRFCARTREAIWSFQRKMSRKILNIDGKIHPAKYNNRVIKNGPDSKKMMITLLNMYAAEGVLYSDSNDIVEAVKKLAPSIVFV
ncbi:MAG TPA: hypothetical protein PKY82_20775 [Pyrinomonadaceae bacterium]|nr:hypothetical protein [Pyrinomonadaceae bacterium]